MRIRIRIQNPMLVAWLKKAKGEPSSTPSALTEGRAVPPAGDVGNPLLGERTTATFGSGMLTGAAISSLVPWHALDDVSLSFRIALLAVLSAAFVTFRLALRSKTVRRTGGLVCVMCGGFLMSSGQYLTAGRLTTILVAAGAGAFLCGITLLLRDRMPTRASRERAIQRLLEVEKTAAEATVRQRELSGDEDSSKDVLALARAVGVQPRLQTASEPRQPTPHHSVL